ncbi:MAG: hypothetical protein OEU44_03165, partial [Gammaproteobacteria bacterium]|nr:hypothetical protein [Gammaproteobacteria bacterium]
KGEHDYSGGEDEYTAWTLAAMYGMSKRTNVYVGFTQADCDAAAGDAFSACEVDDVNADGEVDQFSVGLKHKF